MSSYKGQVLNGVKTEKHDRSKRNWKGNKTRKNKTKLKEKDIFATTMYSRKPIVMMIIVILLYALTAMVTVADMYCSVPGPGLSNLHGLRNYTFTVTLGVTEQTQSVAPTITSFLTEPCHC